MLRIGSSLSLILVLSACGGGMPELRLGRERAVSPPEVTVIEAPDADVIRPRARTGAAPQGAAAPQPGSDGFLGETLAGLGTPSEPGLWLVTGLVSDIRHGRVESASGDAVTLELRPSGAAPGAGSQLSLAAMQALGLPLSELATLRVYVD